MALRRSYSRRAAGRTATLSLLATALLLLGTAATSPTWARGVKVTAGKKSERISPMRDAVAQNTPGRSEGYAAGVPRNFAWYCGYYRPTTDGMPPPDFTAVTGWGQIYPKAGAPPA